MEQRKICPACTKKHGFPVWLPISSFGTRKGGVQSYCRLCQNAITRRSQAKQAETMDGQRTLLRLDIPPRDDKRWRGPVGPVLQCIRIRGARLWQS